MQYKTFSFTRDWAGTTSMNSWWFIVWINKPNVNLSSKLFSHSFYFQSMCNNYAQNIHTIIQCSFSRKMKQIQIQQIQKIFVFLCYKSSAEMSRIIFFLKCTYLKQCGTCEEAHSCSGIMGGLWSIHISHCKCSFQLSPHVVGALGQVWSVILCFRGHKLKVCHTPALKSRCSARIDRCCQTLWWRETEALKLSLGVNLFMLQQKIRYTLWGDNVQGKWNRSRLVMK